MEKSVSDIPSESLKKYLLNKVPMKFSTKKTKFVIHRSRIFLVCSSEPAKRLASYIPVGNKLINSFAVSFIISSRIFHNQFPYLSYSVAVSFIVCSRIFHSR